MNALVTALVWGLQWEAAKARNAPGVAPLTSSGSSPTVTSLAASGDDGEKGSLLSKHPTCWPHGFSERSPGQCRDGGLSASPPGREALRFLGGCQGLPAQGKQRDLPALFAAKLLAA